MSNASRSGAGGIIRKSGEEQRAEIMELKRQLAATRQDLQFSKVRSKESS